jgi:hypothetical protein
MILASSFAPSQNTNGFVIGSNPKFNRWSTLLGGLVTRSYPPILEIIPSDVLNSNNKKKKKDKDKTDYELKKEGKDLSLILTRKEPVYQGITTPERAREVYGGSGNYIIGQPLM